MWCQSQEADIGIMADYRSMSFYHMTIPVTITAVKTQTLPTLQGSPLCYPLVLPITLPPPLATILFYEFFWSLCIIYILVTHAFVFFSSYLLFFSWIEIYNFYEVFILTNFSLPVSVIIYSTFILKRIPLLRVISVEYIVKNGTIVLTCNVSFYSFCCLLLDHTPERLYYVRSTAYMYSLFFTVS